MGGFSLKSHGLPITVVAKSSPSAIVAPDAPGLVMLIEPVASERSGFRETIAIRMKSKAPSRRAFTMSSSGKSSWQVSRLLTVVRPPKVLVLRGADGWFRDFLQAAFWPLMHMRPSDPLRAIPLVY